MESEMELWRLSKSCDPGEPCGPGRLELCLSTVAGFGYIWMILDVFRLLEGRGLWSHLYMEIQGIRRERGAGEVMNDSRQDKSHSWHRYANLWGQWMVWLSMLWLLLSPHASADPTCIRFEQAGWCVWVALTPPHRVSTFSSIPGVGDALISECPEEGRLLLIKYSSPPNLASALRCRGPPQPAPFQLRGEVNRIPALPGFPRAEAAETSSAGGHGPKRSGPSARSMMPHGSWTSG